MKQLRKHLTGFFRKYSVHLISWGAFITYEVAVVSLITGQFASFWDYALHYAINISLFYLHASLVLPFALKNRPTQFWLIPLLVLGELLSYMAVVYAVEYLATTYFSLQLTRPFVFDYLYIVRSVWRAIYFMGFATGYYYFLTSSKERQRAESAERQHLLQIISQQRLQHELVRSQHAFLKAQINPHFLFNTLNFVYNSVRKSSPQASETILCLSDMMRYALQDEEEQQVADLLEEVVQAENLIHIHQIRHDHRLQVQLTKGENLAGLKIIPLVLITLVENVFQHGELNDSAHPARISVHYTNHVLRVTTTNLISPTSRAGHRIGLDNIRTRMAHAYQENASLQTQADKKGYFHTELSIAYPQAIRRPDSTACRKKKHAATCSSTSVYSAAQRVYW